MITGFVIRPSAPSRIVEVHPTEGREFAEIEWGGEWEAIMTCHPSNCGTSIVFWNTNQKLFIQEAYKCDVPMNIEVRSNESSPMTFTVGKSIVLSGGDGTVSITCKNE